MEARVASRDLALFVNAGDFSGVVIPCSLGIYYNDLMISIQIKCVCPFSERKFKEHLPGTILSNKNPINPPVNEAVPNSTLITWSRSSEP